MAEAWRKEEPLTTADLAGTPTRSGAENPKPEPVREDSDLASDGGPRLVRNEQRYGGTGEALTGSASQDESFSPASSAPAKDSSRDMSNTGGSTPLLSETELSDLRNRWSDIQAGFVDEPRRSVERADELVASAIQRLAEGFARERASLEKQWESGSNVSTEDLRLALQRYRSFFGRLLNAA
jgi:hypothetical protein